MEYTITMTFRTLVQVPSVLPTPPPSAVPSTPLRHQQPGQTASTPFGGVILVVVTFPCGGISSSSSSRKEEEEGLDDRTTAILSPQEALTKDWLRAREAGDNSRPLRVLVEAEGPNIALPAADEGVSPWLMRLDPASAAALATSFRTAAHGGKELVS
ncbi:hypothetical protein N7497_002218 [Penicillium chrysogenum]|nr:hypothetical protein N7497_002218 [Penicillium chrysogenum]